MRNFGMSKRGKPYNTCVHWTRLTRTLAHRIALISVFGANVVRFLNRLTSNAKTVGRLRPGAKMSDKPVFEKCPNCKKDLHNALFRHLFGALAGSEASEKR